MTGTVVAAARAPLADSRAAGRFALLAAAALGYGVILTPILFVCWLSFFDNELVTFAPQGYTLLLTVTSNWIAQRRYRR